MSEPIQTRIRIKRKGGDDIAYFTDKQVFDNLDIESDEEFTDLFHLSIGTIIPTEDGVKLKIVEILTHFIGKTYNNSGDYGMNVYGSGEKRFPFNFEVTYLVEEV